MKTPEIKSTVVVKPSDADGVGRMLLEIVETRRTGHFYGLKAVDALERIPVETLEEVGSALLAIGNDTDAIVAPSEYIGAIYSEPEHKLQQVPPGTPGAVPIGSVIGDPDDPRRSIHEPWVLPAAQHDAEDRGEDLNDRTFSYEEIVVSASEMLGGCPGDNPEYERGMAELIMNCMGLSGDDVPRIMEDMRRHAAESPRFEVKMLDKDIPVFQVYDNAEGRYCDGVFDGRDTAETWAHVLSEAEGVPEAPEPVPLQVDAEAAKMVAEVLQFLATTNPYSEGWVVLVRDQLRRVARWQIEDVASCLKSLSDDVNAMIIQREHDTCL